MLLCLPCAWPSTGLARLSGDGNARVCTGTEQGFCDHNRAICHYNSSFTFEHSLRFSRADVVMLEGSEWTSDCASESQEADAAKSHPVHRCTARERRYKSSSKFWGPRDTAFGGGAISVSRARTASALRARSGRESQGHDTRAICAPKDAVGPRAGKHARATGRGRDARTTQRTCGS